MIGGPDEYDLEPSFGVFPEMSDACVVYLPWICIDEPCPLCFMHVYVFVIEVTYGRSIGFDYWSASPSMLITMLPD